MCFKSNMKNIGAQEVVGSGRHGMQFRLYILFLHVLHLPLFRNGQGGNSKSSIFLHLPLLSHCGYSRSSVHMSIIVIWPVIE